LEGDRNVDYSLQHASKAGSARSRIQVILSILIAVSLSTFGLSPAYASTAVITYMSTGATSGTAPTSEAVARNSTVTLKAPGNLVKTGLVFKGWSTAQNGGGTFYPQPGTIAIGEADVTLFPAFGGTVTFNSSGAFGTPSSTSLEFVENRPITLPTQGTMNKSSFNFAGWKDGLSATSYAGPGTSFTLPSGRASGSILYAAWTRSVQYSLNGATIGAVPPAQVWLEGTPGLTLPN
jgi:hypothetical protein